MPEMPSHITAFAGSLLLPPLCLLIPGFAGFFLLRRHPRVGKSLLGTALGLLWLVSTPAAGDFLLGRLDQEAELAERHHPQDYLRAKAIVVLSAGRYEYSVELHGATVDAQSLERMRHAASLYRQTKLPLLVTGGRMEPGEPSIASMLKTVAGEFAVPVTWTEDQARTTHENALFSHRILAAEGIRSILLVTHGAHMPRARRAFERAGFEVIPAATGLHHRTTLTFEDFLPSPGGLANSSFFFHEVIGLAWYEIIQAGASRQAEE